MPVVRAKMRVTRKTASTENSSYGPPAPVARETVELQPVAGPGNEEWSKWTPSGKVEMQITNVDALAKFEVGKDYFVDFTPVDTAPSA